MTTKLVVVIALTLVLIADVVSATSQGQFLESFLDLFKPDVCPSYASQPNLNISRFLGVWYDLASTDLTFMGAKCSKTMFNLASDEHGNQFFITMDNSLIIANSELMTTLHEFYFIDPSQPGELIFSQEVKDTSVFGPTSRVVNVRLSPIYTDYDNILVMYQCYEQKRNFVLHKVYEVYFMTRSRTFDSFRQFEAALNAVTNFEIDFNKLKFVYNANDCIN